MSIKIFITGTDTGVGKTYISVGLLNAFNQQGYTTMGLKPISSGGMFVNNCLVNQDALDLIAASSIKLDYRLINPFAFEAPVAPHIAAAQENKFLSIQKINTELKLTFPYPADIKIIEGVGGWFVPLNKNEMMSDFVKFHRFPVILVVGIRLGCINHAVLTLQAIKSANLQVIGWIANCMDKSVLFSREIIYTLQAHLNIPFLGEVPYHQKPENFIDIKKITSKLWYRQKKIFG